VLVEYPIKCFGSLLKRFRRRHSLEFFLDRHPGSAPFERRAGPLFRKRKVNCTGGIFHDSTNPLISRTAPRE
jgi:hypothetical protein